MLNKVFLLFLFVSCASHHTQGYVLSHESDFAGVMSVEASSLKVGDVLNIYRDQCRPGPRMYLICDKIMLGKAEITSINEDKLAHFEMKHPTKLKEGDYLEKR